MEFLGQALKCIEPEQDRPTCRRTDRQTDRQVRPNALPSRIRWWRQTIYMSKRSHGSRRYNSYFVVEMSPAMMLSVISTFRQFCWGVWVRLTTFAWLRSITKYQKQSSRLLLVSVSNLTAADMWRRYNGAMGALSLGSAAMGS